MLDRTIFMRRFYDEVYNRRNVDFLRQHLHPDVLYSSIRKMPYSYHPESLISGVQSR